MKIDAELGRKKYGSILAIAIGRGLEPPDNITDFQTKLDGLVGRMVV
jgi:hypothetical protein